METAKDGADRIGAKDGKDAGKEAGTKAVAKVAAIAHARGRGAPAGDEIGEAVRLYEEPGAIVEVEDTWTFARPVRVVRIRARLTPEVVTLLEDFVDAMGDDEAEGSGFVDGILPYVIEDATPRGG